MRAELSDQLNVRISKETKHKLESLASTNGLKAADLARLAVEQLLRQNKIELIVKRPATAGADGHPELFNGKEEPAHA